MRLIDADKLSEEIKSLQVIIGGSQIFLIEAKQSVLRVINEQPTVGETKEINSCKECSHYHAESHMGGIVPMCCKGGKVMLLSNINAIPDKCPMNKKEQK